MSDFEYKNKYDDEFFKNFEEQYNMKQAEPAERAPAHTVSEIRTSSAARPQNTVASPHRRVKRRLKPQFKNALLALTAMILVFTLSVLLLPNMLGSKTKAGSYVSTGSPDQGDSANAKVNIPRADDDTIVLGEDVDAKNCVLTDITDNRMVAQKGADEILFPASMTKILTLITAVENITDWNATFTFSYTITDPLYEQGASVVGFLANETVGIKDMLYGTILASGADATTGLAITTAGSEDAFVGLMNEKARELGIETLNFTNASGLHNNEHKCTVTDIAVLLDYAMQNEQCREILTAVDYTTEPTEQHPEGITITSTLFSRIYGNEPEGAVITAGKTGYTVEAGNCIASFAEGENGHQYICVTAGGSDKWKAVYDHINLYSAYAK